ncbi:MAG: efflux RND transporter periplasmic adaptor subunit [Kiritimatiellia bacterium]
MMNKQIKIRWAAIVAVMSLFGQTLATVDDHAGHDHTKACDQTKVDDHAGHDHATETEPARVIVTKEQVARLGIKVSQAVQGALGREIRVPGEIKINSDQMAHVVPRAAGIAREVLKNQGDQVQKGEILTWIESAELAEAKLDFFAKQAAVGSSKLKLPRAQEIFVNVAKMVALLKKEASEEEVRTLEGLEMGQYRGELLPAYVAYLAARTTHQREVELHAKAISSGQELLTVATTLQQARAQFQAALDTASYETRMAYSEAAQEHQVAVFNAVAAEKRLSLKGAEPEVIAHLRTLVPQAVGVVPCACVDPTCPEVQLPSVADTLGMDKRFAWYALRAPFNGTVLQRHIVVGESLDVSSELFTIADLSSVWVNMTLSQEITSLVKTGYPMTVHLPDGSQAEAQTDFIAAVVDPNTRNGLARATLPNPSGLFRPGTFVDIALRMPVNATAVIVPRESVQTVHDHPCVFVWSQDAFEMREVAIGEANATTIEILKGLKAGEAIASANAFHLKAEVSKSGNAPACGHAH